MLDIEDVDDASLLTCSPAIENNPDLFSFSNTSVVTSTTSLENGPYMDTLDYVFGDVDLSDHTTIAARVRMLEPFLYIDRSSREAGMAGMAIDSLINHNKLHLLVERMAFHGRMAGQLIDHAGRKIVEQVHPNPFCAKYTKSTEEGVQRCLASNARLNLVTLGKPQHGVCHTGLFADGAMAIEVDKTHIASFVFGGIAVAPANPATIAQARALARDLGVQDEDGMVTAFESSAARPEHQIKSIAETVAVVCSMLSSVAARNLEVRKKWQLARLEAQTKEAALMVTPSSRVLDLFANPAGKPLGSAPVVGLGVALLQTLLLPVLIAHTFMGRYDDRAGAMQGIMALFSLPAAAPFVPPYLMAVVGLVYLVAVIAQVVWNQFSIRSDNSTALNRGRRGATGLLLALPTVLSACLVGSLGCAVSAVLTTATDAQQSAAELVAVSVAAVVALGLVVVFAAAAFFVQLVLAPPPTFLSAEPLTAGLVAAVAVLSAAATGACVGVHVVDLTGLDALSTLVTLVARGVTALLAVVVDAVGLALLLWGAPFRRLRLNLLHAAILGAAAVVPLSSVLFSAVELATAKDVIPTNASQVIELGLAVALAGLSIVAALLASYVTLIRIRYCERLVLAVLLQPELAQRTRFDLFKSTLLEPGQRAMLIRRVVAEKPTSLAIASLSAASVRTIEIGTRPLVDRDGAAFGRSGPDDINQETMVKAGLTVLRRAVALYHNTATVTLSTVILVASTHGAETINSSQAMLTALIEESYRKVRFDQQLFARGVSGFITQMKHVFVLGGHEQASAHLEIERMLNAARKHHMVALRHLAHFWPLLAHRTPDLKAVVRQAELVGTTANEAEALYLHLFKRFPGEAVIREWLLFFLDTVMRDKAAVQRIKVEYADEVDADSDDSESLSSASSMTRTGKSAEKQTTIAQLQQSLLVVLVINLVLLGLTFVFVFAVAELIRAVHSTMSSVHQLSYDIQQAALLASTLALDQTYIDQAYSEPLAPLMEASHDSIVTNFDFLFTLPDNFPKTFLSRHHHVITPSATEYTPIDIWVVAVRVASALSTVANRTAGFSADLYADETIAQAQEYIVSNAVRLFPGICLTLLDEARAETLSLVRESALILGVVAIAQMVIITVLSFWLVSRSFTSVLRSCDMALATCLGASKAQVQRQIRIVHAMRERFTDIEKDLTVMDPDSDSPVPSLGFDLTDTSFFLEPETSSVHARRQADRALLRDSKTSSIDGDDSPTWVKKEIRPAHYKSITAELVTVGSEDKLQSFNNDDVLWKSPDSPGHKRRVSFTPHATETAGPVFHLDSEKRAEDFPVEEESSGPSSMSSDEALVMEAMRTHKRGLVAEVKLFLRTKFKSKQVGASTDSFNSNHTPGDTGISVIEMAGLMLAIAIFSIGVIFTIIRFGLLLSNLLGAFESFEALSGHLSFDPIAFLGTHTLASLHLARFVVGGDVASFNSYQTTFLGDVSFSELLSAFETSPSIGTSPEMAAALQAWDLSFYYERVALNVAAFGHGYSADLVVLFDVAWNFSSETYHGFDSGMYGHNETTWYTDTAYDTTARTAAEQVTLATAIVFDRKLTDSLDSYWSALDNLNGVVSDSIEPPETLSTALILVGLSACNIVCTLIAVAPTALIRERRRRQMAHQVIVGAALLVVVACIGAVVTTIAPLSYAVLNSYDDVATARDSMAAFNSLNIAVHQTLTAVQRFAVNVDEFALESLGAAFAVLDDSRETYLAVAESDSQLDTDDFETYLEIVNRTMNIASCLAASSASIDERALPSRLVGFEWDSSDDRPIDQTRYGTRTADLELPVSNQAEMALALVLTGVQIPTDLGDLVDAASAVRDGRVGSVLCTVEWTRLAYMGTAVTSLCIVFATLMFSLFFMLPSMLIGLSSFHRHRRESTVQVRRKALNYSLRKYFYGTVAALLVIAGCVIVILAVAFLLIMLDYFMSEYLSGTSPADTLVMGLTSEALALSTGPGNNARMAGNFVARTEEFEAIIGELKPPSIVIEYALQGTLPDDLVPTIAGYTALAASFSSNDQFPVGTAVEMLKVAQPIAEVLFDTFMDRHQRMMYVLSGAEVATVGLCVSNSIVIVGLYAIVLKHLLRQLDIKSRSFVLLDRQITG
ncbi:Sensory domain found in PocR [Carpediemonas membranifera]|uniref:Sensory domain found in PocR n=1 Tax=Carpediemonas membranifera TaxID=201153 RepID=A0A8J6AQM8_9EUKA|nr:Sensory domain found in PocR [Carpediemonas membranifera]|eukprot:KAG9391258.1 Sensory domain found in PocR [Carpediemonas membranifera]